MTMQKLKYNIYIFPNKIDNNIKEQSCQKQWSFCSPRIIMSLGGSGVTTSCIEMHENNCESNAKENRKLV